jgi:hypothetical protein
MRRPRLRFTVGTLLFAVAVVAANFWGFRRFYETDMYTGGTIGYRLLPAGVGVLPLFNVALIGTWSFVTRRLRSPHQRLAANPRSSLSGVAYFSLNFLLLGGLVSLLMPGAIQSLLDALDVATEFTADRWTAAFGEPGGSTPWVILETLVLGGIISGPPLILSWIGQVLVTRCAATLPRWRFQVVTCLVSLGSASAALAICLTPQPMEEEREVVCITDPFGDESTFPPPRAFTDHDGRVRLTNHFVVRGERNAFRIMGFFSPWGRWLEVSAAGYGTRRLPLTEPLGPFADPVRPSSREVALARGETRAGSFRDLAGMYTDGRQGFGGRWFEIEPDGRFAWCAWGCVPPGSQEYGYLTRNGNLIEVVPVPHPGRDIDPEVTVTFRAIEWGTHRYLSPTGPHELGRFCREALTANRPSKSDYVQGSYLRESDRDKPRTGLPRLPSEVWVKFLIDELNLDNEEGGLRLALDSLRRPRAGSYRDPGEVRQ